MRDRNWVLFLQASLPAAQGPIKIEGIRGREITGRLRALVANNPNPTYLIGATLSPMPDPATHAKAIGDQHGSASMQRGWFAPTPKLLAFIAHAAQAPLHELLTSMRSGNGEVIDTAAMAKHLGVSTVTVRRMVKARQIPFLRVGPQLRFVVADVLATLKGV
jgi:excisionase family DNA binding protein